MRFYLMSDLFLLAMATALGCDRLPTAAPSAAPAAAQDTSFFTDGGKLGLMHFRVRLWGKSVGQRIPAAEGPVKNVKEYFAETPHVADFFVEPGAERIAITDLGNGKRIALYLKNLRVVADHAEADVFGVKSNFGFRGPPAIRVNAGYSVTRFGSEQEPQPTRFVVGTPVEGRMSPVGYSRYDASMGPDFSVETGQNFTIELVELTDLSRALKDDPLLDNTVPVAAQAEAERDMQPTSRPSAR